MGADNFIADRDEDEVQDQINKAIEHHGRSKWPGMTYEDGVRNTFDWLTGDNEAPPMEDDA